MVQLFTVQTCKGGAAKGILDWPDIDSCITHGTKQKSHTENSVVEAWKSTFIDNVFKKKVMSTNKRKSYTYFIFASVLLFIRVKNTQHNIMYLISIRIDGEGHCSGPTPQTLILHQCHIYSFLGVNRINTKNRTS